MQQNRKQNYISYYLRFQGKQSKIARLTVTQNYWGPGLCPTSGIKKLEHDVSETDTVSETSCLVF
jgi:hypothetical protein